MKSVDKRITRKKLVVLIRGRWWYSKHECIVNLANWRLSRVETVKKKKIKLWPGDTKWLHKRIQENFKVVIRSHCRCRPTRLFVDSGAEFYPHPCQLYAMTQCFSLRNFFPPIIALGHYVFYEFYLFFIIIYPFSKDGQFLMYEEGRKFTLWSSAISRT